MIINQRERWIILSENIKDQEKKQDQDQEDLENFKQSTNSDNDSLSDQDNEQEEVKEGLDPMQITQMIAKITSQFIPENEQEDYMNSYINTTYPILEMIDFEELTEGASFKDMPDWARMSVAGGALLIP